MDLADLRREYTRSGLRRDDLQENPARQFRQWFDQARLAKLLEPNAMSLATASTTGAPSVRTVLMKAFDDRGVVFFTHYHSRKGRELEENPQAALLFAWLALERQVSLNGKVVKIDREASAAYFAKRPRSNQISAWTSQQSSAVGSRGDLQQAWHAVAERFADQPVPLPPQWGGYRLQPCRYVFWQGREGRLHDCFRYERQADRSWLIERLAP